MTIYIINLVTIGLLSLFGSILSRVHRQPVKLYRRLSWIVAAQLIVILALRDQEVGSDIGRYVRHFSTHVRDDASRYEPGYLALVRLIQRFTDDWSLFLTAIALASLVPVGIWIARESVRPLFSWLTYICLGFYAFTFSGLRQAVAFGLIALAMVAIRKRWCVRFFLIVGLAATFHFSAVLFLPAYWIFWIHLSRSSLILFVFVTSIVFVFREAIFLRFATVFYGSYSVTASESYTWLAFCAILTFGIYLRLDGMRVMDPNRVGYLNLTIVGLLLMIFASVGTNAMRVADYYFHAVVVALPLALSTIRGRWKVLVQGGVLVVLLSVYYTLMSESPYSIVPYSWILD